MGEAKRRRKLQSEELAAFSPEDYFRGVIDLHMLPPVAEINGARIYALTGDESISETTRLILWAFRAVVGKRAFHV